MREAAYNINALVSGHTNLGALRTQINADNTHGCWGGGVWWDVWEASSAWQRDCHSNSNQTVRKLLHKMEILRAGTGGRNNAGSDRKLKRVLQGLKFSGGFKKVLFCCPQTQQRCLSARHAAWTAKPRAPQCQ